MRSSLSPSALVGYLTRQLDHFFPDGSRHDVESVVGIGLERLEHCFRRVRLRGYRQGDEVFFNHLHSDQYATFLYLASNSAWADLGDIGLASKLFFLNKSLTGFMCMYDTILPSQFLIIHTTGMMLGKAAYGDFFVAVHTANVGTDRGRTPSLGKGVVLYGGGAIVGSCSIGDGVVVATHSVIRNTDIAAGMLVAGVSPSLTIKPVTRKIAAEFFDME